MKYDSAIEGNVSKAENLEDPISNKNDESINVFEDETLTEGKMSI